MATDCIPQFTFGFESKGKLGVAAFDMPDTSTDGGGQGPYTHLVPPSDRRYGDV